jgi:hypothetical protein
MLPVRLGYAITGATLLGLATPDQPYAVTAALSVLCGLGPGLAIPPPSLPYSTWCHASDPASPPPL